MSTNLLDAATKKKNEGNEKFLAKSFSQAIQLYDEGLEICKKKEQTEEEGQEEEEEEKKMLNDLQVVLHSNKSQCLIGLSEFLKARQSTHQALLLNPEHSKSLYRYVQASSKVQDRRIQHEALLKCEAAILKLKQQKQNQKQQEDPVLASFVEIYEKELTSSSSSSSTSSLAMQLRPRCSHFLNSPSATSCFICFMPKCPENETTFITCSCRAAAFCCSAHRELAQKEHSVVCELIGAQASCDAEQEEEQEGTKKEDEEKSNLQFITAIRQLFILKNKREPTEREFELLRVTPRCICGAILPRFNCPKCTSVVFCSCSKSCKKTKANGGRGKHNDASCKALNLFSRASYEFWLNPSDSFDVPLLLNSSSSSSFTQVASEIEKYAKANQNINSIHLHNFYREKFSPLKLDFNNNNNHEVDLIGDKVKEAKLALIHDSFSWPLSILYAVIKSKSHDALQQRIKRETQGRVGGGGGGGSLVVHVVGAEYETAIFSRASILEELLHLFDSASCLHVVIVGPEVRVEGSHKKLVSRSLTSSASSIMCPDCCQKNKKIFVHFRSALYETFIQEQFQQQQNSSSSPQLSHPHLTALFNSGIHEEQHGDLQQQNPWVPALGLILSSSNAHLRIFTSYDENESAADRQVVASVLEYVEKQEQHQQTSKSEKKKKENTKSPILSPSFRNGFSSPLKKLDPGRYDGTLFCQHAFMFYVF